MPIQPTPTVVPVVAGDMLTAATLNSYGSNVTNLYNYVMAGFYTQKPLTVLQANANNSIADSTDSIVFPASAPTAFDNFGQWVAGPTGGIACQKAGWWRVSLVLKWASNAAGHRTAFICVNGNNTATNTVACDNKNPPPAGLEGGGNYCQAVVHLAVGATVTPMCNQSSGGALNLTTDFGGSSFSAEWLAPY